jgi:hypothetical protein
MARGVKTGGRKPGSKNKRTVELAAAAENAAQAIAQALGEVFEGDAHAFLMAVYKDMTRPIETRIDAAKAAIRFEKPTLATLDSKTEVVHRYVADVPEVAATVDQWHKQHAPATLQ